MPVTITATLVGTRTPSHVQIEVDGVTVGDQVTITGTAGSSVWTVRGAGAITAASTQIIRRDTIAPVNASITYRADVAGVTYVATALTVPHASDYVLTTLGGDLAAELAWVSNGDEIAMQDGAHLSYVHGRRNPVVRYAPAGGESGAWEFVTASAAATEALRAMLATSAPLVMRTSGAVQDLRAQRVVVIQGSRRRLNSIAGEGREWTAPWVEVDDPLATVAAPRATFAQVNTVADDEGGTFAALSAYIDTLGGTFADFNRHDWETAAS